MLVRQRVSALEWTPKLDHVTSKKTLRLLRAFPCSQKVLQHALGFLCIETCSQPHFSTAQLVRNLRNILKHSETTSWYSPSIGCSGWTLPVGILMMMQPVHPMSSMSSKRWIVLRRKKFTTKAAGVALLRIKPGILWVTSPVRPLWNSSDLMDVFLKYVIGNIWDIIYIYIPATI